MSDNLKSLARVEYGASPREIRAIDPTSFGIYGTGGFLGYAIKTLFKGPLVVVARKGTLDNPIFVPDDCWVIDTAFAVLPSKGVDAKWLFYQLLNYDLKKLNESTGVPSISRDYLYRIAFDTPSLPEQRRIAKILSTVDAVIEKTEQVIAKYKATKQGMMHDLFTRGLDENGKLRSRYEDAPHLYKKTKLGWLPKEWEVGAIRDITNRIWIGLVTTMTTHYVDDGIKLIRNNNIKENEIIKNELIFLDNKFADQNKQRYLRKGDIVTVHTGDIGTSAIINDDFDNSHGFATINTTPNNNIVIGSYLCNYFNLIELKHRIQIYATGDGRENFNLYDYVNILVSYPQDIEEQKNICHYIQNIRRLLNTEQTYLEKIQKLKRSLMLDLLTGRKRVKVQERTAIA